ncbi:MAG: hypothetical protein Kow0062_03130 [Acidobacteriota bacterium]
MLRRFLDDTLDLLLDLLIALRILRRPRAWYRERIRRRRDAVQAERENRRRAIAARHRMCPECGTLNPRSSSRCERCGASMAGVPGGGWLRAVRGFLPSLGSASTTIAGLLATLFAALVVAAGGFESLFELPFDLLLRVGVLVPFGYREFAWWRLLTAVFLHAGIVHLAFNLWVLTSLGPRVEQEIGAARFVVLFVVSGAAGFLASALLIRGTSLGASGAIFGLIGFGLAWGHRRGVRALRDEMLRWTVLGFVVLPLLGFALRLRPDHAAHAGGFVCGLLFGLALAAGPGGGRFGERLWQLAAVVCGMATTAAFGMAVAAALAARG